MAPVTHIVMFEFKPEVTKAQRDEFSAEMLDLKNKCIHPKTNQAYILRSTGGTDNSIEGFQHGISHAFVVEFASPEDREYYVKEDPAHLAFVQKLFPSLAKPYVVDFTPGEFN
ncbi:stress responsive A/B barrel domain protein [Cordyceps fumosorosea ARSEF 2679]|uniref:Stress responsive A/B barrel domain protein n=1 Tax=Cordyceps fumosorosea (strain ARSEF 2679) TaxID=1081104 RepID=A0A167YA05_CORFA|nr:stress responsive A/B barrel domain protein [Cordyceps fumosorosea ARSEF 2679]OAA66045.1 stress responsive A/B barrel domain protein [Cordyceps fumosorosea ARSEF 2679]